MPTPITVNPKTGFTITDPNMVAEGVVAATIEWGTASGGPYPNSYVVPPALITADEATGAVLVPIGSVPLPAGLSYVVCYTANAVGNSVVSDEVGVRIVSAVPQAPTFTVA